MSYRWLWPVCSLLLLAATPASADSAARPAAESLVTAPLATQQQEDAHLEQLEQLMAQQVNTERAKAGLKPLTYDIELSDVARAHSQEMHDRKYFGHISPTSGLKTALDRYRSAFKVAPPVVAENLYGAWGGKLEQLSDGDMRHAHVALMHSPTHRANILFPNLTHIGIGIVTDDSGDLLLTEMFISSKAPQSLAATTKQQATATKPAG